LVQVAVAAEQVTVSQVAVETDKLVKTVAVPTEVVTVTAHLTVADLKTDLVAVDGLAKDLVTTSEDRLDLTALLVLVLYMVMVQTLADSPAVQAVGVLEAVAVATLVEALLLTLDKTVQALVASARSLETAHHR
jgi:hypothetical protein